VTVSKAQRLAFDPRAWLSGSTHSGFRFRWFSFRFSCSCRFRGFGFRLGLLVMVNRVWFLIPLVPHSRFTGFGLGLTGSRFRELAFPINGKTWCLFICLSIYLFISLLKSVQVYLNLPMSINIFQHLSISFNICQNVSKWIKTWQYLSKPVNTYQHLPISSNICQYLSISIYFYVYIYLYIFPSFHLSICPCIYIHITKFNARGAL
jgi:hypothetical protein